MTTTPEVLDSRRLTGPNLFWDRPGAVLDVALGDASAEDAVRAWTAQARRILDATGWAAEGTAHRIHRASISLAISAPIDALYAATLLNEWAWDAAEQVLAGGPEPDVSGAAARLRGEIDAEVNPALIALAEAAAARGVLLLSDDDEASVGSGAGSRTWSVRELPEPGAVAWDDVLDVPTAMVTGTNGKTTTVRLLAAMVEAAGKVAGVSSTDWIRVGDEVVDRGDYSGPGGARTVLRDRRVDVAILETARGGMLRRGLAATQVDVALVTNVAADHLGEFGVDDVAMLAETKLLVRRAARRLVLNADDPLIAQAGSHVSQPVTWYTTEADNPIVTAHLAAGHEAVIADGGELLRCTGAEREVVCRIDAVPLTLGGAARHNVSNAAGAIGVATALGLPVGAICGGLTAFRSTADVNPGRQNEYRLGDVHVIVDFAHNPHGVAALMQMAAALPAGRRAILLGQAGDRDDESIRDLARRCWDCRPDLVVVKELARYLRGRALGEIPQIIEDELLALGAPREAVVRADDEMGAVRRALSWCRPGDLLLLISHEKRGAIFALLGELAAAGWQPGDPLPAACPCGGGATYGGCCEPWHQGAPAPTPEALMRSRYAAYAAGLTQYVLDTTHPDGPQHQTDRRRWAAEVEAFAEHTEFIRLDVLEADAEGDVGHVTFRATLRQAGADASFSERSRFERVHGRWLYHSGEHA